MHATGDVVEVIPYLLGFHPVESLVMMFLHRGEMRLTARADLCGGPEALGRVIRVAARRCEADAVFLAAYSSSPSAEDILLAQVADDELPSIVDAVRVDAGRWWSVLDADHGEARGDGCVAAEAVYAGLTAAPTRAEAVVAAAAPPAAEVPALRQEAERQRGTLPASLDDRVAETLSAFAGRLDKTADLPTAERLRLAVLVGSDVAVRDAVLLTTTQDNAEAAVRLWSQVVHSAPPGEEVAPLCLLGLAAWLSGNGALLVECVERALVADPACTMAQLLGQIADAALPPEAWQGVADDIGAAVPR